MLIDPRLSSDQLRLFTLWIKTQKVVGMTFEDGVSEVTENVILPSHGSRSRLLEGNGYLDLTLQDAFDYYLADAAAGAFLDGVVAGRAKIDFRCDVRIDLGTIGATQPVIADHMTGNTDLRLGSLHILNNEGELVGGRRVRTALRKCNGGEGSEEQHRDC